MNNPPSRSVNRSLIVRWTITVLAVVLLVYLLSQQKWREIISTVRTIPWEGFFLAVLFTLISRLAVSGRWYVLLSSTGVKITPWQSIRITFAGLFASNFLPTTVGGDVVRLGGTLLLKLDQAVCLASLVVDRLVGMAGMAMALPFMLPVVGKGFSDTPTSLIPSVFFLGNSIIPKQGWFQKFSEKVKFSIRRFLEAFKLWFWQPKALLKALGFSWVHMLCLFISIWILLHGMNQDISFWLIAGLWSVTYFVTLLPISINGIGVQELIMAFMFTHFGGVSNAAGLSLALFIRVMQMIVSLPGAFFFPGMMVGNR